jgi:FSR family fosmidomycin resistance protein-like MFS transporter
MSATATVDTARQDMKILGLISTGHFMSHFYVLALPPLFAFLVADFGIGYTELGFVMTAIFGASAIAQVPMGFIVDRYGSRRVLTIGLIIMSAAIGLVGFAQTFWHLIPLAVFIAIGNSVFHPCDYAILNSSISGKRMGRAFSIHTFAGHLGSAVAPATMILLAATFGWRVALALVGLFGILVVFALATQWKSLQDDAIPKNKDKKTAPEPGVKDGWALLFSAPMLLFLLFFAMLSMMSAAMQSFFVSALSNLHATPIAAASLALTVYLFCTAGGILIGGEISDRTKRHDIVAGIVFVLSALITFAVAWTDLGLALLIAFMVIMGLGQGIIRPARDMMLRAASPKGSTGKVFGFVSAGIVGGAALTPIPFGYLLDIGKPEWVFYLLSIFMIVALVTVIIPKNMRGAPVK